MRRRTTRVAAALSAAGAVVALAGGCTSAPAEDEVETLPEVTLQTFDAPGRQTGEGEGEVYLPDVEGPAVVNLWAAWCTACREELPLIEQFAQDHGDQVRVLGIDYLESLPDKAVELVEDSGLSYQLLEDPDGELDGASPFPALRGLPFWAFVDADGRVVHQEFVIIESEQQLVDLAEEHLGVRL